MSTRVVCLPGFLCDERLWTYQKEVLKSHDTKFLDLRFASNLNQMIADIAQAHTDPFTIIGFSMGAYVAQVFATLYPEKVQQLILIGATGSPLTDVEYKARIQTRNILRKVSYGGLSTKELKHYLHPNALENETIRTLILQMAASNNTEMYLNQMNATLERQDLKMSLNGLRFPVTLIGGAQDQIAPRTKMESFHKAIPRSTLHIIEESGHFIPLEKPEEVSAIFATALKHF
ncbi:alpha/beta fold hydrolase [Bdellovibrio sp. HCB209]|uniref:alpha/beta fold hydrolase n=1 Tax=Bdellovibrio sp. HCB209 TaxID=3394354 RepID=UPI0039B3D974